jgi:hypothetical protein
MKQWVVITAVFFSLTSVTKPFIDPIIEGAPSVQLPIHRIRDKPQLSK